MLCAPPTKNNPLVSCECISKSDYKSIFLHDLGRDCLGDEPPVIIVDPPIPPPRPTKPLIVKRVSSQDQCDAGTRFDRKACACFSEIECKNLCPKPTKKNPLDGCGCISKSDDYSIFRHDLGRDCLGDEPPVIIVDPPIPPPRPTKPLIVKRVSG